MTESPSGSSRMAVKRSAGRPLRSRWWRWSADGFRGPAGPLTGSGAHRSSGLQLPALQGGYGSGGMRGTWAPGWTTRSRDLLHDPPELARRNARIHRQARVAQTASSRRKSRRREAPSRVGWVTPSAFGGRSDAVTWHPHAIAADDRRDIRQEGCAERQDHTSGGERLARTPAPTAKKQRIAAS